MSDQNKEQESGAVEREPLPTAQERPDPRDRRRKTWGPATDNPEGISWLRRRIQEEQDAVEKLSVMAEKCQSEDYQYILEKILPAEQIRIAVQAFEQNSPEDTDFAKNMVLAAYEFRANFLLTRKMESVTQELEIRKSQVLDMIDRLERALRKHKNG